METYLIKSTAILAIFWLLYVSFLEKENMHRFKRFYLLASIVAAFCIPLLSITEYIYVEPIADGFQFSNEAIPFNIDEALPIIETPFWTLNRILLAIYFLGVTIFSIRFFRNMFTMVKTIVANEKQKQSSITFVLLKKLVNPHTFFNFIFLNKTKFQKNEVPKEVILHEETHAKQKHSLDILFIEILQIVFWFQPFIWLYKRRIKLNHEFLADQAVIDKGVQPATYQNTLLSYSSHQDYSLSNAINYSSIKKRFTVMKTQTSQRKKWLISLLVLPILGLLFYSFSDREIVEIQVEKNDTIQNIKDELTEAELLELVYSDRASETLMNEYKAFIKKYKETNIIYGDSYERAKIIYDELMSAAQRASVEKYPEPFVKMPNLSKTTAKAPTKTQFEDFKNAKKYAIWIDNKHIPNSELSNYQASDFIHYSGSKVFKNARSEKFPQPNQYHLYTKEGFKTTYQDSQIKRYYKAATKYTDAIQLYIKGPQTDNSELKILKTQADAIYQTFSKAEIKANDIKQTPPVPAEYKTPRHTSNQNPPTKKEIAEYNAWAKKTKAKFKTMPESEKVNGYPHMINDETYRYHNSIYDRMSKSQKDTAESLPEAVLVTEWPMPTAVIVDEISNQQNPPTKKEIAEYNTWAKALQLKIKDAEEDRKLDYPIIKKKDIDKYLSIYNRMSSKQKTSAEAFPNIPPPPPPPPTKVKQYKNGNKKTLSQIIKETPKNIESGYEVLDNGESHYYTVYKGKKTYYNKDGYITDDKGNVLPPPPPPPPAPKKNKSKGGPNANTLQNVTIDCLELPKSFITKDGNKLTISCIEDYQKNELQIYNRWGNLIYSKINYNNDWDGKVQESFAAKGSDKPISGTYYYVISSPKLEEPKAGFLFINETNFDSVEIKKSKSKGGPNPDYKKSNWNEDYTIRQLILRMSKSQTKPLVFKLNNTETNVDEVEKFITEHNDADVYLRTGKENILEFTKKQDSKMTKEELQVIYTALYKTYSEKDTKGIYYRKVD